MSTEETRSKLGVKVGAVLLSVYVYLVAGQVLDVGSTAAAFVLWVVAVGLLILAWEY